MIPLDHRIRNTGYYIINEIVFFSYDNVHFEENIAFIDLWWNNKILLNYGLQSLAGILLESPSVRIDDYYRNKISCFLTPTSACYHFFYHFKIFL